MNNKSWWIYPAVVVTVLIMSAIWFMGNDELWNTIAGREKRIAENQKQISALKTRLSVLDSVDVYQAADDLTAVLKVMPASRQLWVMVSEAKAAASESGLVVDSFKGLGGNVGEASQAAIMPTEGPLQLEFSVNPPNIESLQMYLARLERKLPLLRVIKIEFDPAKTIITIEGAWNPWGKIAADANRPLPDYTEILGNLKTKLTGYEELVPEEVVVGETGSVNPF